MNGQDPSVQLPNLPSTPRRLIPVLIDPDHIGLLEEAILRLSLAKPTQAVPMFSHQDENEIGIPPSQQPMADHEELVIFDGQSLYASESDDSLEVAPLSCLSTSTISNLTASTVSSPTMLLQLPSRNSTPTSFESPLTPQSSTAASFPLDGSASPGVSFRNPSSLSSPASA